jgi:AcrR family transcriptional regulator
MVTADASRPNQRTRTRKDLLEAASRLMKQGRRPTLDEIAEEALVSRATAYRYFPSVEALLIEAPIEDAVPGPEDVFGDTSPNDPVERLERVDAALNDMISANELPLRLMLASSVRRGVNGKVHGDLPARQNRRTALIEAALAPARSQFTPSTLKKLTMSLALIIGTESMVVLKDVLQLDEPAARKVRRWAIRALVEAARKPSSSD